MDCFSAPGQLVGVQTCSLKQTDRLTERQISLGTLFALLGQTFRLHLGALSLPLNED